MGESEDAEAWREFLLASEREMKEQLISEIISLKQMIASMESHKSQLEAQVAQEFGGAVVEYHLKGVEMMTDAEKEELERNQADTEAIYRRMIEEVNSLSRRQADFKFLQWKADKLQISDKDHKVKTDSLEVSGKTEQVTVAF